MRRTLLNCLLACLLSLLCAAAPAQERVVLQLKWTHAFQFAGYYAARELGYYREAGLDVTIRPGLPGSDTLQEVLAGRAQYGVGNSSLLLARNAGKPVVALAVIFQHSPAVLLAREDAIPNGPEDLAGKRIMIESQLDESLAYLRQLGISSKGMVEVPHSLNIQDLISGKVDAITAYSTFEPWFLDQAGFRYRMLMPISAGIDFYGDNLFTTEAEIRAHPERVRAFRAASLRGWQYAMAHPEQVVDWLLARYKAPYSREFYLHEAAAMKPLLRADLIEIGYMNPVRWLHIADTYADMGMLPRFFPLGDFLYDFNPPHDLTTLYYVGGLMITVAAIALYIYAVNRRLGRALADSQQKSEALRISEERHRLLAEHASDLIWTMDLEGRFTYISPSAERLFGYTPAEILPYPLQAVVTPASAPQAAEALESLGRAIRQGEAAPIWRGELEHPHRDGHMVWTETTVSAVRDSGGANAGLMGVSRDITARRLAEQQMRHMAQHDTLTGLPNRALFADRLQLALAAARRDGTRLALMFIDLDKFKPVNDSLGHRAGDLLLQQVAQRLQGAVRASDSVARIGGDEFVALLREVEGADAARASGDKLCAALRPPFDLDVHQVTISASIGIALYPDHGEDDITLSKHADAAMYAAKQDGSDRACLHGDLQIPK